MNRATKTLLGVAGTVLVSALAAFAVGARRWDRATERALDHLDPAPIPAGTPTTFTLDQLDGLPPPVARYFRFALVSGQPVVRRVRIWHAGDFATRPGRWAPFTSVQHVTVRPPGFVWDATIWMGGLPVRVRDSYLDGEGSMHGAVGGVWPLVRQHGTPEMASASLMRYLAEAVWLPTALLPSAGVEWSPLDSTSSRARITVGGTTVSIDVHFGVRGEIARVSAERYRDVDGTPVLTPWEGLFSGYERVGGLMIPMAGEVAWLTPEGRHVYWRGRVVRAAYE